jgi:hypothetical protein
MGEWGGKDINKSSEGVDLTFARQGYLKMINRCCLSKLIQINSKLNSLHNGRLQIQNRENSGR